MAKYSEAQKRAVAKYNSKSYDELKIRVTKGKKAELQEHAQKQNESLNAFVNRAIDNQVEQDNNEPKQEIKKSKLEELLEKNKQIREQEPEEDLKLPWEE